MFELKVTGLVLATGEATFVDDMPTFSNELFMAPVLRYVGFPYIMIFHLKQQ